MDKQIKQLIEEAINNLKELLDSKKHEKEYFRDVPPVLWFGDITLDNEVLVISANPSRPDEPLDAPRIPSSKEWNIENANIEQLYENYNDYFSHKNRYTNWFGDNYERQDNDKRQGRIEDFLNGMDASFYGTKKRHAVHIDLLPYSTNKSFTKIANDLLQIPNITAWIDKHIQDLVEIIKPEIVIVNGVSNFVYFNLCVNMGAQPYQISEYENTTIWRSSKYSSKPIIVGVSMNMGSSCRKPWKEVYELGRHVNTLIKETKTRKLV